MRVDTRRLGLSSAGRLFHGYGKAEETQVSEPVFRYRVNTATPDSQSRLLDALGVICTAYRRGGLTEEQARELAERAHKAFG